MRKLWIHRGKVQVKELDDDRLKTIFSQQLGSGCIITNWEEWEPFVRNAHAQLVNVERQAG